MPKSGLAGAGNAVKPAFTSAASSALSGSEAGSTVSRVCTGIQIVSQMPRKMSASMTAGSLAADSVNTTGSETGLNTALKAARSRHVELGLRARWGEHSRARLAAFDVHTRDELAVQANSGGRSVFQNAGRTQRQGLEAQWLGRWPNGVGVQLAAAWLEAHYREGFARFVPWHGMRKLVQVEGFRHRAWRIETEEDPLRWFGELEDPEAFAQLVAERTGLAWDVTAA